VQGSVTEVTSQLRKVPQQPTASLEDLDDAIGKATTQLDEARAELIALMQSQMKAPRAPLNTALATATGRSPPVGGPEAAVAERAEVLALKAEQFSTLVVAINQAIALNPVAEKSERETLEAFFKSNAIFFSTSTNYRSQRATDQTLKALAELAQNGQLLIRVVGYTDETGTRSDNVILAQRRAEQVRNDLITRGLPGRRLVAVGRADGRTLAPVTGDNSPNRRVQFEVGYAGELAQ
ncbi:MAG: OmpA family protein, partial [Pseudomonadota bacterium]